MLWIGAEFRKWGRRRLLDKQSSLDSIRALPWQEFEHLVGEAYRREGYHVEETGTSSGDGGIDLILRGGSETVLVQCKQWKVRSVGVKPVRELFGVLTAERADRAVLVTCGTFTKGAVDFARGKPLRLVAGEEVLSLVRSGQRGSAAKPTPEPAAASSKPMVKPVRAPAPTVTRATVSARSDADTHR